MIRQGVRICRNAVRMLPETVSGCYRNMQYLLNSRKIIPMQEFPHPDTQKVFVVFLQFLRFYIFYRVVQTTQ